ncbi:MAG TPA: peroxide stress protein YaaA [Burkholderiaceae bacterium]
MLFLLSPAKTLDYESALPQPVIDARAALRPAATAPQYAVRSAELIEVLRRLGPADVAALMELSDELARLNVERYHAWSPRATARNSRPAMWAFDGDVYDGLQARTLDAGGIAWAQSHLLILSGLYGVLRPLDRLQPYRLEMGRPLVTARGANLYAFWGDTIAAHLNRLQAREREPVVVNLASQEYFKVTQARAGRAKVLRARVVECVFEDWKAGEWKVISFFAKRARGRMARHAIDHRIETPEDLRYFEADGYAYAPAASAPDRLVFRRRVAG